MPRPKPFTEAARRERHKERGKIVNSAFRRAYAPTAAESNRDIAEAADLLAVLGFPSNRRQAPQTAKVVAELVDLFAEIRWHWQTRSGIQSDRSLPILGGVQPTHGEMLATLQDGLQRAEKLREWHRALPAGLLPNPLRLGIEQIAEELARLTGEQAQKVHPGHQSGQRAAAQFAARYLVCFIDRHAPDAPGTRQRDFVFRAMRKLGIDCPDRCGSASEFNAWFCEVAALVRPPSTSPK